MAKIRVILLPKVPAYGDVGPFEATMSVHDYLRCYACGAPILGGRTTRGAIIFGCPVCHVVADVRRIA